MATASALRRVGVVVVTHRSAETVGATLRSLPPGVGAVVVVDNASADGAPDDRTVAVATEAMPAGGRLVEQANVGFGGGCNAGVAALPECADLVLFLNPDAEIAADDLERLVVHLDAHPRAGMVGPRLRGTDGPQHSAGREASLLTEVAPLLPAAIGRRLPYKRFPPSYDEPGPVGYVEGACMLLRRTDLAAVGGFDERYFLFFEELDLAVRLRALGREVHLVPTAWADHVGAASRSSAPFAARPFLVTSAARYLRVHRGRTAAVAWGLVARASWWLRVRSGRLPGAERDALVTALTRA